MAANRLLLFLALLLFGCRLFGSTQNHEREIDAFQVYIICFLVLKFNKKIFQVFLLASLFTDIL